MEKENKNIVLKTIHLINSNLVVAIFFYTLYYLIVFYVFASTSRWITISFLLGTFSGLFFRFIIYEEKYGRKKRLKITLWLMVGVPIFFVVVEIIIKRIV